MANKLLFKTSTSNDSSYLTKSNSTVAKAPGTVYFTKDGKIVYDLDSSTRLIMSDNVSYAATAGTAEKATGDKNGKDITTYMAYAKWDTTDDTTLHLQNSSGTNIFSAKLADKFLPLVAGSDHPLTGDLHLSAGNEDRFLQFSYTGTGYDWRIGYLGSGTGNENYLVIQSDGSDGVAWTNALRFGLTDLNATFGGSILPSSTGTKDIGSSSLRWKGLYGQTLNITGNATIGDAVTDAHTIKGTITQTGDIIPGANATYNLGSTASKWKALYVGDGTAGSASAGAIIIDGGISASKSSYFGDGLTVAGSVSIGDNVDTDVHTIIGKVTHNGAVYFANGTTYYIGATGNASFNTLTVGGTTTLKSTATTRAIKPNSTNTYDLGTSSVVWRNVYATTFTGNLTGTAAKATSDSSGRNIEETYLKSVSFEDEYKLYGTVGNGTKTLIGNVAQLDSDNLIPLKYLPATALERIHLVDTEDDRLDLTILEVQNGDVVRVNETSLMYLVYDDTKLGTEDAFRVFVAGSAASADTARYAESAGKATNDSDGNKISTSYIKYPFTLNADKTQVTIANGVGTKTTLDYNYYPTAMTWTAGTSAGPTATIDMAGTADISVGAIPTATDSASGIVIVGSQTFGGAKTFDNNVTVQKILSAGSGNNATSTTTGDLRISGGAGITKDVWVGGNLYLSGNNDDKYLVFEHTGSDKYDWRIGYLGKGEGDANYLTFQSKGESTSYTNVIKLGATTHDATFAADIFPDVTEANDIGSSTLRWNNLYAKVGDFSSNVTIGGTATIGGKTTITGDVLPSANATYDLGSSSYKWQLLYVNKTAYIGNGDETTSTATGALQVTGGIAATKSAYIGANLTVKGTTTLGDAETDTVSITGDTTFSSDVVINKTLNVKGAVTLGDAETDAITVNGDTSFTNDVTIGKTLTVTGAVTTKGAVTLGDAESDTVTVNGDASFKNDVTITKTLTVSKQVKVGDGTDISTEPCDLEVVGGVDIGKNLRVTGGTATTATVEFKQEAQVVYDSAKKAFNFVFN